MQKILLVDNDVSFRTVYANALRNEGFDVTPVKDAQSALRQLSQSEFQGVISEILLPGRNGLGLIQDIRLMPRYLTLPIFLLTTLEAADVGIPASLSQSLGVKAYLVKQHTRPAQLTSALRTLLPAA